MLMNPNTVQLLDVVALTEDLPQRGLFRGQVGTVVELLAPEVYEVEFSDDNGRTYASLALRGNQMMVLHYRPLQVA
jgi:hypothetical protein